jgi:putative copper export protein
MIVKFILLILFVWLGLRIYQALQAKKQKKVTSQKPQDMVSCETCGVHVPVNEPKQG